MDCKEGGFSLDEYDSILRFINKGSTSTGPLSGCLAAMGEICTMSTKQAISLFCPVTSVIDASTGYNAWLTVSGITQKSTISVKRTVALTICCIKLNGHDGFDTVHHFPVFLLDIGASYSFAAKSNTSPPAWQLKSLSRPPLLSVSLTENGSRRIGWCDRDGHCRSTYRDPLTDFVIEQTRQIQTLEFGNGVVCCPDQWATTGEDPIDLLFVYRPESGDECVIAIPHTERMRISGYDIATCLGFPEKSCTVERVNSDACNPNSVLPNSGWFNVNWKEQIDRMLQRSILPVLARIISGYVGYHVVSIEPKGRMIARFENAAAFFSKLEIIQDWAWYEWAMVAMSMASYLNEEVESWLDAFADPIRQQKDYCIKFGNQTASRPVTRSVAVTVGAMALRGRCTISEVADLIDTRVDAEGLALDFTMKPITVNRCTGLLKRKCTSLE